MITQIKRNNGTTYSVRDHRDRFFYPKEWMQFFDKLKESQKFTFECLINTGARINEARNIRKEDIDFNNRRLILRVTKVMSLLKQKNPRPRTIPISTQFIRHLKAHFKEKAAKDIIGILSTPAANIAMKKALTRAGIKDWQMFSVHNVRKTLETWMVALNIEDFKITSHFGHSHAVAARHYVSADAFTYQEKEMIRKIIGDLFQKNQY